MEPLYGVATLRRPVALRDQIHDQLRAAIVNGSLPPGTILVEEEIAARFGASRTPVREALRRLEAERLLERRGLRGLVVRTLDEDDVVCVFEIREALESLAARRAKRRLTPDDLAILEHLVAEMRAHVEDRDALERADTAFHDAIADLADDERLRRMLVDARDEILTWRFLSLSSDTRRSDSLHEHEAMLEAFRTGNEDDVARTTAEHLRNTLRSALSRKIEP